MGIVTTDFFISYNKADKTWAEWIAWELEAEGYSTVIQAWDFRPGGNFVLDMQRAAAGAERTIAVLSPDFLTSEFTQPEWAAAFAKDPTGAKKTLLPVRIRKCELTGLLPQIVFIDVVDKTEAEAQHVLLSGIETGRVKPAKKPNPFAARAAEKKHLNKPRFPGTLPPVCNIPHERNRNFTGRDELLEQLRRALISGKPAALVQALHGLGGIGKTQTATEYAYRHLADYDAIWWVRAEEPSTRSGDFAALAKALGLPEADAQNQQIAVEAARMWLSRHDKWLLMLDNVPHPNDLDGLLPPQNNGHILITSRDPNWHARATPVKVEVFPRPDSIEFLLSVGCDKLRRSEGTPRQDSAEDGVPALVPSLSHPTEIAAANDLAEALGDLPLALAQAVAYMGEAQLSPAQYLELFRTQRSGLWGEEHAPLGRQGTVAVTFGLNIEKLADPAAVELLSVCAFLAPDDIPRSLFTDFADELPAALAAAAADQLQFNRVLKTLRSFSLIDLTDKSFSVHRLVQAVCRDRLNVTKSSHREGENQTHSFAAATKLINAAFPRDIPTDTVSWPVCQRLLPHARTAAEWAEQSAIELEVTVQLLKQIGLYLRFCGNYVQSRYVFERAIQIAELIHGREDPVVATVVSDLGVVLSFLGDVAGAKLAYERALAIDESAFGPDDPKVAIRVNNIGVVLRRLGDFPGAKRAYERAIEIDQIAYGPEHHKMAIRLNNLGLVLLELGDLSGAREAIDRALLIDERTFGLDHPSVAIRVASLGNVLQALGDSLGAKLAFERSLRIDQRTFGPDHPKVALRAWKLGGVLQDLGDLPGAKLAFERALGIYKKILGDQHPHTMTVQGSLELVNKWLEFGSL